MTCNAEVQKFTRGQYVEVFGLQSQAGRLMNRQRGLVIQTNDATGRIEVCLGAEGKIASLKPECLRLVVGASVEEIQDAKDVAGPLLRAAQEAGAQQEPDITASTASFQPTERERSRSWSPPPEAVRAASVAAQHASSAAVARGLSAEQAEACGAAAAEESLRLQKHASMNNAAQASSDPVSLEAATDEKMVHNSLEHLKVGDSIKVIGLKGDEADLNGLEAVVQDFQGFGGPRNRRYVVSCTKLVINEQGELAEQKRVLTLTSKNIKLPGDGAAETEPTCAPDIPEEDKRRKKKSSSKRSRSRRRKRRKRSSTSSSSASRDLTIYDRTPAPAMTKAERLRKMGILFGGRR